MEQHQHQVLTFKHVNVAREGSKLKKNNDIFYLGSLHTLQPTNGPFFGRDIEKYCFLCAFERHF